MSQEITQLLLAWNQGDEQALNRLMPLVHDELHRLAHRYMAGERPGHPLQTTALVNEAYLRLIDSSRVRWQNRAHFFAVSAQLMRRILVDVARARAKLKRGGDAIQVSLDEAMDMPREPGADLIALDEALDDAGSVRRAEEQGGRAALFRRLERRGDGRGTEVSADDRHARLGAGEGLAAAGIGKEVNDARTMAGDRAAVSRGARTRRRASAPRF